MFQYLTEYGFIIWVKIENAHEQFHKYLVFCRRAIMPISVHIVRLTCVQPVSSMHIFTCIRHAFVVCLTRIQYICEVVETKI